MNNTIKKKEQTGEIKKPTDNIKITLKSYLESVLKQFGKVIDFNNPYVKALPENVVKEHKQKGIIEYSGKTYEYDVYKNKNQNYLVIKEIINSCLKAVKNFKTAPNNKSEDVPEAKMELYFENSIGKVSDKVILDKSAKSEYKDFNKAVNQSNNSIIVNLTPQSFTELRQEMNNKTVDTIYLLANAGRTNYNDDYESYTLLNANINNGRVIWANEYDEIPIGEDFIVKIDRKSKNKIPELFYGEVDLKNELHALMNNVEHFYKGRIEPFLYMGLMVMYWCWEEITTDRDGFPIAYTYGHSEEGKSLIQKICNNFYGFNRTDSAAGNSTANALAKKCSLYNSIPLYIDDLDKYATSRNSFENNLVAMYSGGTKEKMLDGNSFNNKPLCTSITISSNYMPTAKTKNINRLLPLYFPKNSIDKSLPQGLFPNNPKLSWLMVELSKIKRADMMQYIKNVEVKLGEATKHTHDRLTNNVSIAYAGLKYLECISGYELENSWNKVLEYFEWYLGLFEEILSPLEKLLQEFPYLIKEHKLVENRNFKIKDDNGKIILTIFAKECLNTYNQVIGYRDFEAFINPQEFREDLKASPYLVSKKNEKYGNHIKGQGYSVILDITERPDSHYIYNTAKSTINVLCRKN